LILNHGMKALPFSVGIIVVVGKVKNLCRKKRP